ncbi:MAG: hypothetical protein WA112_00235 [Rugosibacter sp.]
MDRIFQLAGMAAVSIRLKKLRFRNLTNIFSALERFFVRQCTLCHLILLVNL